MAAIGRKKRACLSVEIIVCVYLILSNCFCFLFSSFSSASVEKLTVTSAPQMTYQEMLLNSWWQYENFLCYEHFFHIFPCNIWFCHMCGCWCLLSDRSFHLCKVLRSRFLKMLRRPVQLVFLMLRNCSHCWFSHLASWFWLTSCYRSWKQEATKFSFSHRWFAFLTS